MFFSLLFRFLKVPGQFSGLKANICTFVKKIKIV
jgi:hypothetical protein